MYIIYRYAQILHVQHPFSRGWPKISNNQGFPLFWQENQQAWRFFHDFPMSSEVLPSQHSSGENSEWISRLLFCWSAKIKVKQVLLFVGTTAIILGGLGAHWQWIWSFYHFLSTYPIGNWEKWVGIPLESPVSIHWFAVTYWSASGSLGLFMPPTGRAPRVSARPGFQEGPYW